MLHTNSEVRGGGVGFVSMHIHYIQFIVFFRWHQWAITQTALRAICVDVPENVLPGGSSGQIIDVKVFCKCGPDDDVYDNNKEIRDRVWYQ